MLTHGAFLLIEFIGEIRKPTFHLAHFFYWLVDKLWYLQKMQFHIIVQTLAGLDIVDAVHRMRHCLSEELKSQNVNRDGWTQLLVVLPILSSPKPLIFGLFHT